MVDAAKAVEPVVELVAGERVGVDRADDVLDHVHGRERERERTARCRVDLLFIALREVKRHRRTSG